MDKNLLIMTEMPQYFVNLADKNFNTHKLWMQNNEDEYLSEIKEEVDAKIVDLNIFSRKGVDGRGSPLAVSQ